MYREELLKYFEAHREEMVRDVCDLIRIDSAMGAPEKGKPFGPGPAKALAAAMKLACGMGFSVKNYENYVAAIDLNQCETQLEILAHLDTVPAGEGWTVCGALDPVVRDGRIYGRGATDNKGAVIASLYALKAVRELGIPLSKNARLILGTNEESGCRDIEYYYGVEKQAPMAITPDAEFPVTNIEKAKLTSRFDAKWDEEPALPRIVRAKGGAADNVVPDGAEAAVEGMAEEEIAARCIDAGARTGLAFTVYPDEGLIKIKAAGSGAHASKPWAGNNAVTGMLELLSGLPLAESAGHRALRALGGIFPHGDWEGRSAGVAMRDDISGVLTISLNKFEYSPAGLCGVFDCRAPVCATNENVRDVLKGKMEAGGLTLEKRDLRPAHYLSEDSPLAITLLNCYEIYTGKKGECRVMGGITYVHDHKGGAAFGLSMPGTDYNLHGPDEFAVIDELVLGAAIYAQAIAELCR